MAFFKARRWLKIKAQPKVAAPQAKKAPKKR
jgi:hypothetical protein